MSLYDDYEKQVEKATKDFQERAKKIHDDAMTELDKKVKAEIFKFFLYGGMLAAVFGLSALALYVFGLSNQA